MPDPSRCREKRTSSLRRLSLGSRPSLRATNALTTSVASASGLPMTPASATAGGAAGAVPGDVPAVLKTRLVELVVVPVGTEHGWPGGPYGKVPLLVRRHLVAVVVDDCRRDTREGTAHAAGADVLGGVVGDQDRPRFRLPPVVVDW